MGNSDNRDHYMFVIEADSRFQYLVRMTLFDNDNNIVLEGSQYPMQKTLGQGLYTIRLDTNGSIEDTVFLLNHDVRYKLSHCKEPLTEAGVLMPPPMYSAVPLDEKVYASSQEYYRKPAIDLATLHTWPIQPMTTNSSIYLFVRFYSRERYEQLKNEEKAASMTDFRLLNHLGIVICDLANEAGAIVNDEDGWMVFNGLLSPGLYLLEFTGPEPRQIPVYLLENFHTQLFLVLDKKPVFSSLRIFLQKERRFDPCDARNIYTDLLFTRLQNKDITLEEGLERSICNGELEGFMLHLLYAYITVLAKKEPNDFRYNVMHPLFHHHAWLQGPLPDWRAICILGGSLSGYSGTVEPIRGVPILYPGYLAIKEAAVVPEHKDLIREKSLNDLITVHALYDSLITTFTPVTIKIDELLTVNSNPRWKTKEPTGTPQTDKYREPYYANYYSNIRGDKMWDEFMAGYQGDTANWLEFLIYELVSKEHIRNPELLSQRLRISVITINRTIEEVRRKLYNKAWSSDNQQVQPPATHDPTPARLMKAYYNESLESL
ncbi:hypothetical protein A3860_36440 [Niastella vici]|uniref:Uncharacterized protein n=1 Tax=Niastella vici TaxID=1703345 RepID=A0A1V9FN08_9BACT|nr:hypothetical protein [Niastella vici]OQP59661.1 hypothetical protein A3860_36440 [Niastella vici]